MTNEELLYPRFKLISDFMGNSRPVGSVSVEIATANYFRKFPANFLELEWWEERNVNDLPLYVKTTYNGTTSKIFSCDLQEDTVYIESTKSVYKMSLTDYLSARVPATESEYLAGLKKQI